jgi:hypothetical protein
MKIISIDVGIKNLAFCLFEKIDAITNIVKWDIVNLSQSIVTNCSICGKPAKFIKSDECYCLKHAKKHQMYQIPGADLKSVKKLKIGQLSDLLNKYDIKYDPNFKKGELLNALNVFISDKCFDPISKVNSSKIDLITIGKNIKLKLDVIFEKVFFFDDTIILIENQISPIANRMKTIQGMIAQYFIMKNDKMCIEFISSANKLKGSPISISNSEEKSSYTERKKMGIQRTLESICVDYPIWEPFFKTHLKKDDLADSFLQGKWYISTFENQPLKINL